MYIVYQLPNGQMTVAPVGSPPPPGATQVAGPVSASEASAFMQSGGQGMSSEGVSMTQTGSQYADPYNPAESIDWTAEQNRLAQEQQTQQQREQRQSQTQQQQQSLGAASDYSSNISTGGMNPYLYENVSQGYMPESSTRNPQVPKGHLASDFYRDVNQAGRTGTLGNTGTYLDEAYTPGGNFQMGNDVPMTQLGGWLTGGDFTPQQLMDPLVMTDEWLERTTGGDQHANKGYLRDAFSSYPTLYGLMNPGQVLDPMQQGQFGGDFIGGLSGSTGGNYVDARGLWDQQFGGGYGQSLNDQTSASDNQGQDQYQQVQQNVAALAQWMGPQGVQMAMNLIDNAWIDYNQMGSNPGMSFIDYLRSIGADQWF